jgi:PAS domain S-box-containing protein
LTTESGSPPKTQLFLDVDTPRDQALFQRLTIRFGILAATTSLVGLITAGLGISLTGSINNKMIAFSAALIWIFLGALLAYQSVRPVKWLTGLFLQLFLLIIAAGAALEFFFSVQGSHFVLETLFVRVGAVVLGPSSSPISPVAAALAVLASLAAAIFIRGSGKVERPLWGRHAISILGAVITLVSFTFVLSYAYGNPLLYGTSYIPIAFLSALSAFFIGLTLIAGAGPRAFPIRYMIGNSTRASLLRGFVPLVAAIALVENIMFIGLSSWFDVRDAVLLSTILVVFILATAGVVSRVSGKMGSALDKAEAELVRKNEDLGAMNEELTATQEELRQTNDDLIGHERNLMEKNDELNALNEELTATQEELRQNIDELTRTESGLRESEARLRRFYDSGLIGVIYWNMRGEILDANDKFLEITGYSREDLAKGRINWIHMTPPEFRHLDEASVKELSTTGMNAKPFEKEYFRKDGTRVPILVAGAMLDEAKENGVAFVLDITRRKQVEDELKRQHDDLNAAYEEITATQEELRQNFDELTQREHDLNKALVEKEVLLSEIHHRVKNNLTAFISLLSLEGSTEDSPAGKLLKQDLQNRARSMALVHETLYRTNMYDEVDMGLYLTTLTDQIANSFQTTRSVKTVVDAHGVMLDIPRATPAGLIINELITNSFKYAFPESFDSYEERDASPTITITLSKVDGMYELTFRDNGVGLPPGVDLPTTRTLGLKLVNFLARHQLRAKIDVNVAFGTEFVFRFKE